MEYEKHTKNLKKQLIRKSYPETTVIQEIQKATNQDRTGLLNKEKTETENHLTLCVNLQQNFTQYQNNTRETLEHIECQS